jgi:hypothetical protein
MKITKAQLAKIIKEELREFQEESPASDSRWSPPGQGTVSQADSDAAKGAAMELLDTAKTMEQAPSHDPASNCAQFVAKQANLIMDMLVKMGT